MSSNGFFGKIDSSALITIVGVIFLFSTSIIVTLIAPYFIDPNWVTPSSSYQKQMYEVLDKHVYISTTISGSGDLQTVYHLQKGKTLHAFSETENMKVVAPQELVKYVTPYNDSKLRLTSELFMLREPEGKMKQLADERQKILQANWEKRNANWKAEGLQKPRYTILELYRPGKDEVFALSETDGIIENWVDPGNYTLAEEPREEYHSDSGVVYVHNPKEFRISRYSMGSHEGWVYDSLGVAVKDIEELKGDRLKFLSRSELISMGEQIYAAEGCWYCHTDQTRTLVQDVVLNASDSYPAPPSSANEYIYQNKTFPGTRRIGPDISRVGVKRPNRDWHKAHFWSPKTESPGSIMPSFHHFFDDDPRGTSKNPFGVPNYQFEAIFQYLMTKGTRITPPTEAWWLGRDKVRTIDIIESRSNKRKSAA